MLIMFRMVNGDTVNMSGNYTVQDIFDLLESGATILHFQQERQIINWNHVVWVDSVGD